MRDRTILITAGLILIMSAIAFYSGENVTGYAVGTSDSVVRISHRDVDVGSTITIMINPNSEGINRYATFLKGVSPRGSIKLCPTNRCFEPADVEFKIPENWGEGTHSLKFFDYGTESYEEVHFNVRRK